LEEEEEEEEEEAAAAATLPLRIASDAGSAIDKRKGEVRLKMEGVK
jgi:hypothetical protein